MSDQREVNIKTLYKYVGKQPGKRWDFKTNISQVWFTLRIGDQHRSPAALRIDKLGQLIIESEYHDFFVSTLHDVDINKLVGMIPDPPAKQLMVIEIKSNDETELPDPAATRAAVLGLINMNNGQFTASCPEKGGPFPITVKDDSWSL